MVTYQSALTSISDFSLSSKVATTQQTDSVAHKLKPRLFYKSAHLQFHSVDFHPGMNCAWQYYKTPKSAIASEQFCLLNSLPQFHLQSISLCTSKSKWLSLAIILQLQSYCLGHLLRLLTVDFIFIFSLLFYFYFYFIFYFLFLDRTTWVRIYQSCCHISHKLRA